LRIGVGTHSRDDGDLRGVDLAKASTTGTLVRATSLVRACSRRGPGPPDSFDSETMDDVTTPPARPEPPALMSTLEGVGSLLFIGGSLVCAGTVANPGLASTLLPLGGLGCVAGVVVVWLARFLIRTR
jgi:hypothetical protein